MKTKSNPKSILINKFDFPVYHTTPSLYV